MSVWTAPLDPSTREETTAYVQAWVEDYCEATENLPCTGIDDRAVELCLEKRDCHPGLLVPFQSDAQAFFSGGDYAADAMTIVTVWRPESDSSRGALWRRPAPSRSVPLDHGRVAREAVILTH